MEIIIVSMVCTAIGFLIGYFIMKEVHKKEMALLAADCSNRIQKMHRDLVTVCTEPDSISAMEIRTVVKIEVATEEQVWFGDRTSYTQVKGNKVEIKGIINNLNGNQNGD